MRFAIIMAAIGVIALLAIFLRPDKTDKLIQADEQAHAELTREGKDEK